VNRKLSLSVFTTISLLLFFLLDVSPVKGSSDWVEYFRTNSGDILSYDKDRINNVTKDIVQVWVKDVLSNERKNNLIDYHKYVYNIEMLSHYISLNEIDCKKRMYRSLSVTGRDTDGNDLFSSSDDNSQWNRIPAKSGWETLQKTVCN
jgi:hypothetical protein